MLFKGKVSFDIQDDLLEYDGIKSQCNELKKVLEKILDLSNFTALVDLLNDMVKTMEFDIDGLGARRSLANVVTIMKENNMM